jgi:hypothetical protein
VQEEDGSREQGLEKKVKGGKVQGRSARHERYKKQEEGKKSTKE